MSVGVCGCPVAAALPDVVVAACPANFGQIQKVIFQRLKKADGTLNVIASTILKASWTPLLAAADGTKVVVSPYIQGPAVEPGGAKEFGGGNATLGGIPLIVGKEPTKFTANLFGMSQSTINQLKQLACEEIGVFLINQHGQIGCKTVDATHHYPIPVGAFFVGDMKLGGLEEPDANVISWSFAPNWSDDFDYETPTDFNALTELFKPVA